MRDPYKVEMIQKHLEMMKKDEFYSAQLCGIAGKPINLDEGALELLKQYYSGQEDCLQVETSAGVLKAYKSVDLGQPGICTMLQPKGYDEEIDVTYVSVYEDPDYRTSDNERPEDVVIMIYADATQEDYTCKEFIRREEVVAGLGTGALE